MQDERKKKKNIYVTIVLTESATSLLNLNSLPHVENVQEDNSNICVITPSEYKPETDDSECPGTSTDLDDKEKPINDIFLKISSDFGLFTTSNCSSVSSHQMSEDDLNIENNTEQKSGTFEVTKVHPYPLVTARSMAHSDKLNVNQNNVYVSLLDSDSSSDYQCRICHGGESFDDLLTPCRCRGTIALVHLKCLERWLRESNHSSCELCQHHFKIIREPKYSIPRSILMYLRNPGDNLKDILLDLVAFALYTPSAVASTYMLMMICEQLVKSNIVTSGTLSSHLIAFSAVFGMAAIDFTYSSWLLVTFQRHFEAWREWYRNNSTLKVVLPKIKLRPHKRKLKTMNEEI